MMAVRIAPQWKPPLGHISALFPPGADPIMSAENIAPLLVEELTLLCRQCPKGHYTERCPFGKFAGISEPSRRWMFAQMKPGQVAQLFALATDCVCPKDPREQERTGK